LEVGEMENSMELEFCIIVEMVELRSKESGSMERELDGLEELSC
jgi:hypothetical protein